MTEEEKRKEYRLLIQNKLPIPEKMHIIKMDSKRPDEWVCLRCGKIYLKSKDAIECRCFEITRRDHDAFLKM